MDGNQNMHNTHDNIIKPDNTYLLKLSLNQNVSRMSTKNFSTLH
jgi:hypothetical protein